MQRQLGFLFLVGLCSGWTNGQSLYYTSLNMSRWLEANSSCVLASPDITLINASTEVGVNLGNESLRLYNRTEVWLGYVRQPVLLLHMGCVDVEDNNSRLKVSYRAGNDIGLCLSLCGTKTGTVGVMAKRCFCLADLTGLSLHSQNCTEKCSKPDGVLCGGLSAMSVYSKVPGKASNAILEHLLVYNVGDCVAFNGNTKEMIYSKCSITLRAFCQVAEGQARVLTTASSYYLPWDRIALECTKSGLQSLNYNTTLSIVSFSQIWSGMIRAVSVLDRFVSLNDKIEYGYLKLVNNSYKLMFDTVPSSVRGSLCVNVSNIPSTTTVSTISTASWASPSQGTSPTKAITMPTPEPEPEAEPVTAKTSYMLLVYILVPIVVVLIIVVVVICLVRHRKRRLEIQKIEAELLNELASRDRNVDMSGFVLSTLPRSEKKAHKPVQPNGNAGYDPSGDGQPINGYGTSYHGDGLNATIPLEEDAMTQLDKYKNGRGEENIHGTSPESGRHTNGEYAKIGKHGKGSPGTPLKNRNLGHGNGPYNGPHGPRDPLYDHVPV